MQSQYTERGFCYFAVEKLENQELIGFTGLSEQDFEAEFTPCIDIGWRLKEIEWNKGYATEAARACLHFAFHHLKIKKVYSMAPIVNERSERVMKKLGMEKIGTFLHPKLQNNERLRSCILYEISK